MTFHEKAEEQELFRRGNNSQSNATLIFTSKESAGNNPVKLAQILTAFDLFIKIMNWENKPLASFPQFLTQYQASLDAKYHNDFKDVCIAEEVERRRAERKGISILNDRK